jgi:GNAT superfamily N-acetyltransferase
LNVDFVNHVALVAVTQENGRSMIVGGGRYVLRPREAEVAFVVVDQYQGRGVGGALMRHLAAIARAAGLQRFIAELLVENRAMLRLFEKSGLPVSTKREDGVLHVALRVS